VLAAPLPGWDEPEWKRRLKALRRSDALQPSIVATLVDQAPLPLSVEVVSFALAHPAAGSDQPLIHAGRRLRARLGSLAPETTELDDRLDAVRWPRSAESADTKENLKQALDAAWDGGHTDDGMQLIVAAAQRGRVTMEDAAYLLPRDEIADALRTLAGTPHGFDLAAALAAVRPEQDVVPAASALQREGFAVDLARALAPTKPDVAFAGAAEGWDALSADEQDDVTSLLVEHASALELPLLETIVLDSRKPNAARRARAARTITRLTPEGGKLPDCVVDLLESQTLDLRRAGVEAIGAVKPRDATLIARLQELAAAGGPIARVASGVLDELSSIFLEELSHASSRAEVMDVLPLLGAVGKPAVITPLLGYVGPEAEFDNRDVHRAAASALRSACESVAQDATAKEQEQLVRLLEGESAEVDAIAREDLSAALSRVALGEDAALAELYSAVKLDPRVEPDRLYGAEKDFLVRHVGLWARERDRGAAGRPGQIENMDIICERLVRAAYLKLGPSEKLKAEILAEETKPDYGSLINALQQTPLRGQVADLQTLHTLRCTKSYAHVDLGDAATEEDMVRATASFRDAGKALIGALKQAAK
jgi:hypothetical protein